MPTRHHLCRVAFRTFVFSHSHSFSPERTSFNDEIALNSILTGIQVLKLEYSSADFSKIISHQPKHKAYIYRYVNIGVLTDKQLYKLNYILETPVGGVEWKQQLYFISHELGCLTMKTRWLKIIGREKAKYTVRQWKTLVASKRYENAKNNKMSYNEKHAG